MNEQFPVIENKFKLGEMVWCICGEGVPFSTGMVKILRKKILKINYYVVSSNADKYDIGYVMAATPGYVNEGYHCLESRVFKEKDDAIRFLIGDYKVGVIKYMEERLEKEIIEIESDIHRAVHDCEKLCDKDGSGDIKFVKSDPIAPELAEALQEVMLDEVEKSDD